jgi:hypothetical protein
MADKKIIELPLEGDMTTAEEDKLIFVGDPLNGKLYQGTKAGAVLAASRITTVATTAALAALSGVDYTHAILYKTDDYYTALNGLYTWNNTAGEYTATGGGYWKKQLPAFLDDGNYNLQNLVAVFNDRTTGYGHTYSASKPVMMIVLRNDDGEITNYTWGGMISGSAQGGAINFINQLGTSIGKLQMGTIDDSYNFTPRITIPRTTNGRLIFNSYGSGTYTGTPAKNLQVDSSGNIIETDAIVSIPATVTASNGLTKTTNDIALGGTLTGLTTIAAGSSYYLTITGSGSSAVVQGVNSSSGGGVYGETANGHALEGWATGSGGEALRLTNNAGGITTVQYNTSSSTNISQETARQLRQTSGTAAAGIGLHNTFWIEATDGVTYESMRAATSYTTATAGAMVSVFDVWLQNSGTLARKVRIRGDGQITLDAGLPGDYADNTAATGAGLTAGMLYRSGDAVKIVH